MIQCIYLLLALLLSTAHTQAQERQNFAAPNYELIEKVTKDKANNSYYPKLLQRFRNNDTTLTQREVHLLYYGRFFQEGMANPLGGRSEHIDSISAINALPAQTDNDRRRLMNYYLDDLEEQPFNMNTLFALYSVSTMLHDPRKIYYDKKLEMLMSTIMATGDGKTAKTGWHVGSIADEYAVLGALGLKYSSQSLIGRCDYLAVQKNDLGLSGLYFDIGKILEAEMKMLQPEPEPNNNASKPNETKKKRKE